MHPMHVRYQAALHPDDGRYLIASPTQKQEKTRVGTPSEEDMALNRMVCLLLGFDGLLQRVF